MNQPARSHTYNMQNRYCPKGHDTHAVGVGLDGSCNVCKGRGSYNDAIERQRADKLLKLTTELEHCMPWERREILERIRALKKGYTD